MRHVIQIYTEGGGGGAGANDDASAVAAISAAVYGSGVKLTNVSGCMVCLLQRMLS